MKRGWRSTRYIGVLAALAACGAACDDAPESHVYVAMLYEPARDCLNPSTSLDIIPSPGGSLLCPATCLVLPAPPAVGSETIYVSTMCPPYPTNLDPSGTDPACPMALAAFARGPDTCTPGGGSSNPIDGGADASVDAGPETAAADTGTADAPKDVEPRDAPKG